MPERRIRPNGERIVILEEADTARLKHILVGFALSENMGDVKDYLPSLARALDIDEPEWSDERERMVFPWET